MVSSTGTVGGLAQRRGWGRLYKAGTRKGAIMLPGATQDQSWWWAEDQLETDGEGELRRLTDGFGIPIASCATNDLWGNSTQRTNISTLRTNAQVATFAAGKVHLVGVSAGGTAALNWAKNNPTLVQSISLLIPCVDIQAVHDEDRGGFAADIAAAYGGRPADADNPADYAADLSSIPIQLYYSTTDTITTEAEYLAFAALCGARTLNMGAQGHFWDAPWSGAHLGLFIDETD